MRPADGTMRIVATDDEPPARAQLASALGCLALVVALFLLARRASGAFAGSLPVPQLLITAALVTAWAAMMRVLSKHHPAVIGLAVGTITIFAVACSYPGARVIDWLVWPAAMFTTVLMPPVYRRDDSPLADPAGEAGNKRELAIVRTIAPPGFPAHEEPTTADADQVLQQLTRIRTAAGQEVVHGQFLAEFAPGERQTVVYASFCPPFEQYPRVELSLVDDFDATAKLTQVLHSGAQIEVRLAEPAEEGVGVQVELYATDGGRN